MVNNIKEESQLKDFLSGKFLKIDINAINKQLKEFWSYTQSDEQTDNISITRVCTNNLVVLTDDNEHLDYFNHLIQQIINFNPCRAILAISKLDNQNIIDAYATAICNFTDTGLKKKNCSEQITIKQLYSENDINSIKNHYYELASAVSSLLVPDLPTLLWWHNSNFDIEYFKPFSFSVDTLIVDSDKVRNFYNYISDNDLFKNINIIDLAKVRLDFWCKTIAHNLDEFFHADIKFSEIRMLINKNDYFESLLLIDWFTSKLEWQFLKAKYDHKNKNLDLSFKDPSLRFASHNIDVTISFDEDSSVSVNTIENIANISFYFECNNLEKSIDFKAHDKNILVYDEALINNVPLNITNSDLFIKEIVNINLNYRYCSISPNLNKIINSVNEVLNANISR